MMYSHEQCIPMHQRLVVYSHALLTELALTGVSLYLLLGGVYVYIGGLHL